jgi:hypothetical protein
LNAVFAGQLVLQWDHLISHVWEQEKSGQNVRFNCSFCRANGSPVGPFEFSCVTVLARKIRTKYWI